MSLVAPRALSKQGMVWTGQIDVADPLRAVYLGELGVREATGRNDGLRVGAYLAVTGLGEGHEWCAAFVSWCFARAGYAAPRTPWSPAMFPRERVVWSAAGQVPGASVRQRLPKQGDVFGLYFPEKGRIAHVGFVDVLDGAFIITVEGNSHDAVERRRRALRTVHQEGVEERGVMDEGLILTRDGDEKDCFRNGEYGVRVVHGGL
jgi:hypothetical protein